MWRGSAVSTDNKIYIAPYDSHDIYCYRVKEDTWTKHKATCPQADFGLAEFNGEILAIGGRSGDRVTGKVLTLREEDWREELPPLTQPRRFPAVVSTHNYLFAIGGYTSRGDTCSSVELFHTGDAAWTSLTSLPTPADPAVALIGDILYVMANKEHGYLCSLADILDNKKPRPPLTWKPLPPFPPVVSGYVFTPSSCSLGGQLVIVGGDGTIFQLLHGEWSECGHLTGGYRGYCLLSSPSPATMVAVGDWFSEYGDTVDICTVE